MAKRNKYPTSKFFGVRSSLLNFENFSFLQEHAASDLEDTFVPYLSANIVTSLKHFWLHSNDVEG